MTKRIFAAQSRASGVARLPQRRGGRGSLLLSTALGCSLLVVSAAGVRAETIQQHVEGDIEVVRDVISGSPFVIDLTSDTGDVAIDVNQINVTNNGPGSGYAVSAITFSPDTLISISVDEVTATGTGRVFGIVGQAAGGGSLLINAGAVEGSGDGGYGIWGASQNGGSITINSGTVTTTGGIRNPGTADPRHSHGVWARTDSGDVSITSQSVTTTGFGSAGVSVESESGDTVIDSDTVSTSNTFAPGIMATGANITVTSDTIITTGAASPGIYVPDATGDVTITSNEISTAGGPQALGEDTYISAGIVVESGEDVIVTSQQITTTGGGGFGIAVTDVASATITSGQITTSGNAALGIGAHGVSGAISITSESVSTTGESVVFEGEILAAEGITAGGEGPITIDSGVVTTTGHLAHGIFAESAAGDINITSGQVSTAGDNAQGIFAETTSGDITIDAGTTLTSGDHVVDEVNNPQDWYPDAITAFTGSGSITITSDSATADGFGGSAIAAQAFNGGDIFIDSGHASGDGNGGVVVYVDASYAPGGSATVHSDSIVSNGDGKSALVVLGTGDVFVESGSIVSTGTEFVSGEETFYSGGLIARSYEGDVVVDSGTVSTVGDLARGVVAIADLGSATVTSDSVTTVSARGIQVRAAGDIVIDSGEVHSAVPQGGSGAHAIMVTAGAGAVNITSADIVTEGPNSHGLYVANANGANITGVGTQRAATGGTGALTIDSGAIESSGWGMMIDHQGAIDITSGQVTSGQHGIYVYGGDAITIDSTSVETVNGAGIVARGDEGLLTISSGHVVVGTGGDIGVFGQTSTGDIVINAGDTTTTAPGYVFGFTSDAVGAISNTGDITIVSGATSTQGFGATGVFAFTDGAISVTSGTIHTAGDSGNGLFVGGNGAITLNSGEIHTAGDDNEGGILVIGGAGDIVIDSDLIQATGANSDGIVVTIEGQGPTFGNHAASGGTGLLTINSGEIDVTGVGLFVDHVGAMSIDSGDVSSGGPGIYIYAGGALDLTSGSVDSEFGPAIVVWADDGPVSVTSGEAHAGATGDVGVFVRTTSGDIEIDAGVTTTSNTGLGYNDVTADGIFGWSDTGDVSITSQSVTTKGLYSSGVVTDTAGNVSVTSGSVANSGVSGNGLLIFGGDINVVSGSVATTGSGAAFGIRVLGGGDVVVDSGSVSTTGALTGQGRAYGILAESSGGSVHVTSDSISTTGDRAYGLAADTSAEDADVVVHSGAITTAGAGARGLYAFNTGLGDVTVVSDSVTTTGGLFNGAASEGIRTQGYGAVSVTSGSVSTAGERALGIVNVGGASLSIDSGQVSTAGASAHAIRASGTEGAISITSDDITTTGANAHGIYVAEATGDYIDGLGSWRAATGGTGALTIDSGSIESSSWGMMIDHQGVIDITSDEIVSQGPGIYVYGDAVTVHSGSIEADNAPAIVVWGGEGLVTISSETAVVGEDGDAGIWAQTTSGDIVINAGSTTTLETTIAPSGYATYAVGALSESGDITIVSGSTSAAGDYSAGVLASTGGDVSITSGSVVNTGLLANGILAYANGLVTIDSGTINVSGDGAWGLYVEAGGDVSVTSDAIVNTAALHEESHGLGIFVSTGGEAHIDSGVISTTGENAFGISVYADGDVTLVSDSITTTGAGAFGIAVLDATNATVTTGDITTTGTGEGAAGAVVVARGSVEVTVNGDVSSAHSQGLALQAGVDSTYDIEVTAGSSLYGALGAIALNSDAAATLTIGGHLSSDVDQTVLLAGGDDVVNMVTGGDIEGGLYGEAGFDTLNLNSTVNSGVGIGQSVDDVVGFEKINLINGRWTVGGDLALDTTLTGGTLVITGSLTDDVTIGQLATLQIGNGGTTGSLIGDLVINGTAIFNRSDEYDFGGDISGAGTFVKEGGEKLILSGAYNFNGTTVLNGGGIKIIHLPQTAEIVVQEGVLDLSGTDQELASLSGGQEATVDINNGSLTLNQQGTTIFSGEITGDGSLTLTGGGVFTLAGTNTYTGPTNVDDGTLKINGSINSDTTVGENGTLGGDGEINGDVEVFGTVGPGNSPGLLTVDGDFNFASGSTYEAEVEADGDHDQIDVTGATTIEDDVTLAVLAGNGDYARLSTYTILTSDLGITGTFDNITTNLAFLTPHLTYSATEVELSLTRNDVTFASFATTDNQTNVAEAIEAADFGDPLYDALVVQSAEASEAAYTQLSGELYASLPTVLLHQSRYAREAVLDRAARAGEGRAVWGELIGSTLEFDANGQNAAVQSTGRGFAVGADTSMHGWRAGVAVTHIRSEIESAGLASEADVKTTTLGGYVSGQAGPFKTTVGASFARHDVDAERAVAFPSFTDALTADYDGTSGEIFGEVSMGHQLGGVFLEPFVGLGFAAIDLDGFSEEGGDAALVVGSVNREVSTATIGLRASGSFETQMGVISPYAKVALQSVYGDDEADLTSTFASGQAFTVGGHAADDGVLFDLGVRIDHGNLGFTASYSGVSDEDWSDEAARIGVSFRF